MPTRNVNLTEHFDRFVSEQIASGQFKNASEVMRAGLSLLEHQKREEEVKLDLLRKLAADGFETVDRGDAVLLDGDEAIQRHIAKIGVRIARRSKSVRNGA